MPMGPMSISLMYSAKELLVELKTAFEVRCVEFVPTDGTGGGRWGNSPAQACPGRE